MTDRCPTVSEVSYMFAALCVDVDPRPGFLFDPRRCGKCHTARVHDPP
jgi:hypothetical protein